MDKLPSSASIATPVEGAKLHAPAAARNAEALCNLIAAQGPAQGTALEIASGTGQHCLAFAQAFPKIDWHPSEVNCARLASIDAYRRDAGLPNLRPPVALDATRPGWHRDHAASDLIVLVNLLHLVNAAQARTIVAEALQALSGQGRFVLYGPFKRNQLLTSAGDAAFHDQLTGANPDIGYKNDADVEAWMTEAGASRVQRIEMPANNLAFIAIR